MIWGPTNTFCEAGCWGNPTGIVSASRPRRPLKLSIFGPKIVNFWAGTIRKKKSDDAGSIFKKKSFFWEVDLGSFWAWRWLGRGLGVVPRPVRISLDGPGTIFFLIFQEGSRKFPLVPPIKFQSSSVSKFYKKCNTARDRRSEGRWSFPESDSI